MKSDYRLMLGKRSSHAEECFKNNYIGADFGIDQNLAPMLHDDWRAFNRELIPVYLASHPGKTKIGAGLACGALWTVSKGIQQSDIVLCPDGKGSYRTAEVVGDYRYVPGKPLPPSASGALVGSDYSSLLHERRSPELSRRALDRGRADGHHQLPAGD